MLYAAIVLMLVSVYFATFGMRAAAIRAMSEVDAGQKDAWFNLFITANNLTYISQLFWCSGWILLPFAQWLPKSFGWNSLINLDTFRLCGVLFFIPISIIICTFYYPVYLKGFSRAKTFLQVMEGWIWRTTTLGISVALLIESEMRLVLNNYSPIVFILLFIMLIYIARRRLVKLADIQTVVIDSGPLIEKIHELAAKLKVQIQHVLYLNTRNSSFANAFAVYNGNIMYTDLILTRLNCEEVDAITAHELMHQRGKDPSKLYIYYMIIYDGAMILFFLLFLTVPYENLLPFIGVIVIFSLNLPFRSMLTQRMEYKADAGSVKLIGDARPLIRALICLHSINEMPTVLAKREQKATSHPSLMKRIEYLAKVGGLTPSDIDDCLISSLQPPTQLYDPPAEVVQSEDVLFSSADRIKAVNSHMVLFALAVSIPIPLIAAVVPDGAYIGLLVSCVLLWDNNCILMSGVLHKYLKLQNSRNKDPQIAGIPVMISPDRDVKFFTSMRFWDMGLLIFHPEYLEYIGDKIRFNLNRNSFELVQEKGIISRTRVLIRITQSEAEVREMQFVMLSSRAAKRFRERISEWINEVKSPGASLSLLHEHQMPSFPEIVSQTPSQALRTRQLGVYIRIQCCISFILVLTLFIDINNYLPITSIIIATIMLDIYIIIWYTKMKKTYNIAMK